MLSVEATAAAARQPDRMFRGMAPFRPGRSKRPFAPDLLAGALVSLLPLCCAMAQETPPAARDAGDTDPRKDEPTQGQATTAGSSSQHGDDPDEQPTPRRAEATELEQITVTGTRIRGGTTPSPVIVVGSEQIHQEGFTDLGEVIRAVPQNFAGGQNPGVVTATGSGNLYNQNATGGSSLNLRGLGPDATLTLLNGKRLPNSGFGQAVDISAIPVEAVDRIDIVTDGASAVYGSDAVAGVGNVVLKREYDGVAVGARAGRATDGGLATKEYTATAGATWANGGLIATYKHAEVDPIRASQRSYTAHMYEPFVIVPGGGLDSGLLSAHQRLGERVEFHLDAFRTERDQIAFQSYPAFYYRGDSNTTTTFVSPGIEFALPGDWAGSVAAAWGRDRSMQQFHLLAAGSDVSTTVLDYCLCNEGRTFDLGAEGPLFALPGGDARLAAGAGERASRYENASYLQGTQEGGRQSSRHVYVEMNMPVVSPDIAIAGVYRLELSAAVRMERYDSFGSVSTPKLGLIYGPTADFTLKASWGKSFKEPMLSQTYANRVAALWTAEAAGGTGFSSDATVLMAFGGNPELKPERARTVTTSLAFHPTRLPGLEMELTWFRVRYEQRVIQPIPAYNRMLADPALSDYILYSPDDEALEALLANYSYAFYNYAGVDYDPANVVAIAYSQYTNAMQQMVDGVDLMGSYRMDLGAGSLTLRGSASWLESSQRNVANQPAFDLSGTLFYPARASARVGSVWSEGGLAVSAFANYVDGVTDRVSGRRTSSTTTLDTTIRYATGRDHGPWSGVEISVAGQNLLNQRPPMYSSESFTEVPYDSTNYSPIGRFLSVSVSKQW